MQVEARKEHDNDDYPRNKKEHDGYDALTSLTHSTSEQQTAQDKDILNKIPLTVQESLSSKSFRGNPS